VPDPITTAIATAVASQAAQALTSQAGQAMAEITARIRQKFSGRSGDLAILASAQDDPDSPEAISRLAQALRQAARKDPVFANEILALWTRSQTETTSAAGDGTVNVFRGQADKVIQLRDVHGDLTIN
jgi:hypothetical protein